MARTGCANVGSLRVVKMTVVWPVSMSSPMVTKAIKRNVCCCALLCAAVQNLSQNSGTFRYLWRDKAGTECNTESNSLDFETPKNVLF